MYLSNSPISSPKLLVANVTYVMDTVQIQLEVTKMDHGLYKLDLICMQQSGILVQLSQAIEAFVIEIVHTSIVVIKSTKVICTFIVKVNLHIRLYLRRKSIMQMNSFNYKIIDIPLI